MAGNARTEHNHSVQSSELLRSDLVGVAGKGAADDSWSTFKHTKIKVRVDWMAIAEKVAGQTDAKRR
jgi:hypothetical protein